MAGQLRNVIDALRHRRMLRHWSRALAGAERLDLFALRRLRSRARQLRRRLDRVIHVADGRLALPLIGSNAIETPLHSDWAWRPQLWRGPVSPPGIAAAPSRQALGDELRVFHDCGRSELTLRQQRNRREDDLAPFGLQMDVFGFDGSFLSLVIDLPGQALDGLKRRHLLRMAAVIELEAPLEIFARLNIRHGPNTEQMVRELQIIDGRAEVDFDLAYSNINERRLERAWLELIFEGPQMNQVVLRDLTFSRRPRAEL